jgi:hypothetical protein
MPEVVVGVYDEGSQQSSCLLIVNPELIKLNYKAGENSVNQ